MSSFCTNLQMSRCSHRSTMLRSRHFALHKNNLIIDDFLCSAVLMSSFCTNLQMSRCLHATKKSRTAVARLSFLVNFQLLFRLWALCLLWAISALLSRALSLNLSLWALSLCRTLCALHLWLATRLTACPLLLRLSTTCYHSYRCEGDNRQCHNLLHNRNVFKVL